MSKQVRWISANLYHAMCQLRDADFSPEEAVLVISQVNQAYSDFVLGAEETLGKDFVYRTQLITDISEKTLHYAAEAVFKYRVKTEMEDITDGEL